VQVRGQPWGSLIGLAGLCGARTIAPLAVLATVSRKAGAPEPGPLGHRSAPALLGTWAAAELVMDKARWIPARTRPLLAVGRAVAGAAVGATLAHGRRRGVLAAALLGAGTALIGTFATYAIRERVRRWTGWPSAALGALEDVAVVAGAVALARRLQPRADLASSLP
jgi:uncharacterized membrane protein